MPFRLLSAILLVIASSSVAADDTAFGGTGAAPMPIKKTNVSMLSEHVIISGHDITRADMKGKWDFDCDYTFKNESNALLNFTMGFPFPINDELGETTIPEGYTSQKGKALVYDFKLTINGVKTPAKLLKITPLPDKDLNYDHAYIWPMSLAPKEIVKIHHHYITGITVNSMGQYYVSFVLKTGGLWRGGLIHAAHLQVMPNTPTRTCAELDPTSEYLQPKPPGLKIVGDKKTRKYIWELNNFKPNDDLSLCLIPSKNYVHYYVVFPVLQGLLHLDKLSADELQKLRNTLYAQYGRQFNSASLQTYFNDQWWYEINPHYTDHLLTAEDKQALALIQQAEAKLKP